MIIVVSGTPGVGKSTVANALAKKLNIKLIHLSSFLIQNKAYSEFDEKRETYIIDEEKTELLVNQLLLKEKDLVIETIYPALVTRADKVIVLRRNPLILYEELKKRGWNELKVAENVEAEILGIVSREASESFSKVCEIDTSNKSLDEILDKIEKEMCEKIDWLGDEKVQLLLFELDKVISKNEDYETSE
ncbi:adenylate kinase family protein [Stygiolobus caldivivus]|uniref:adenylate kinase family protein n=1 Tax=Stygiolobus caldivivus TaxID=2824673 RepID=UPI001C84815D|nr:adenylate kinase family protein [Stygiolobus caldivivus]